MQEQLLQFIWHKQLFDTSKLVSTEGRPITVLHPGMPNQGQGPDFLQARIKSEPHLWAGHVEIHILSSAWFVHQHHIDPHYNNVILHVVWEEDVPALTMQQVRITCLELSPIVDRELLVRYETLMNNTSWIPCAGSLHLIPSLIKTSWLERLMTERLQYKTKRIDQIFRRCQCDYEQTFFVLLARQMGAPSNSDPMEELGYKVPLSLLRKHSDRIDQIEAILFGVAGMLSKTIAMDYPDRLCKEFNFLRKKYGLSVIPSLQWRFMRMRPAHFPTVRIAQLSKLISGTMHFVTLLTEVKDAYKWLDLLQVKPHDAFWDDHYHFKSVAPPSIKKLGKGSALAIIINVVAPFMFYYGRKQGVEDLQDRAVQILLSLPREHNSILQNWSAHSLPPQNAGESQALLELKARYCDERRCLQCAFGMHLMKIEGTNGH